MMNKTRDFVWRKRGVAECRAEVFTGPKGPCVRLTLLNGTPATAAIAALWPYLPEVRIPHPPVTWVTDTDGEWETAGFGDAGYTAFPALGDLPDLPEQEPWVYPPAGVPDLDAAP